MITPKFIETNPTTQLSTNSLVVKGRIIDDVIVQDYATLPNAVQFPEKGNIAESEHEGTIEFWATGSVASGDYFVDTRDNSGNNGMRLYMSDASTLSLNYHSSSSSVSVTGSTSTYSSGSANHILMRWWQPTDSTLGMSLYLNGKKIGENTSQSFTPTNHTNIVIGNDSIPDSSADFDGSIYDFAVYSQLFDDGGVAAGVMAGTGSSVFNAYKSIANDQLRITNYELPSGATVNARDGSNTTYSVDRGVLLNASGSTEVCHASSVFG